MKVIIPLWLHSGRRCLAMIVLPLATSPRKQISVGKTICRMTGCFDVHTASKPDEAYFIASTDATKQILHTMARYNGKCPLCGFSLDTESLGFLRHGHAAGISLSCAAGHSLRWFSSSVISGKFTVNLRYVTYLVNFDEVDTNFINQVLVEQKI